jgi:tetratricopeptide (TPR) repeat protein
LKQTERRVRCRWSPTLLIAGALAAGSLAGCVPLRGYSSVVVTPPSSRSAASGVPAVMAADSSLAAIIDNQIQSGHYARAEQSLRKYLKRHPDDRAAQGMLRQLTVDPEQWLGHRSRTHVVQPGESYSTLAARYLGDANLFLILARYNGSTDPSLLRTGQTLRIPLSAAGDLPTITVTDGGADANASSTDSRTAAAGPESASAKVRRLQDESVALFDQGQTGQALARMGEALAIDPRLKPAGSKAAMLRSRLLDSYHERAVVLYRDQKLDQAIALWNRVLAIAPGYEPAIAYRARALELKQRLRQY